MSKPKRYTESERRAILSDYAKVERGGRKDFLAKHGLFSSYITSWTRAFARGNPVEPTEIRTSAPVSPVASQAATPGVRTKRACVRRANQPGSLENMLNGALASVKPASAALARLQEENGALRALLKVMLGD